MNNLDMSNLYLIPANAKRGNLIFNIFRVFDLILFLSGVGFSLLLLSFVDTSNLFFLIIVCLPGCICSLLVLPIPNYHNVLCVLQSIFEFYSKQRKYKWRGWCLYEQFKENNKK